MKSTKRKAISKGLRFEVFKRDGFACMYCGAHPPEVLLHVDHIIPVADGGGNEITNLITSCAPCNLGKSAKSLDSIPQSMKDRAADVAEREAQIAGYSAVFEQRRQRLDGEAWKVLDLLLAEPQTVPRDQFNSTRMFIEKLGFHSVFEAAEIALAAPGIRGNRLFKYFCGVCWNRVRGAAR